jgi:RNA polymerase sigma-70 factor (ECF subfamily)
MLKLSCPTLVPIPKSVGTPPKGILPPKAELPSRTVAWDSLQVLADPVDLARSPSGDDSDDAFVKLFALARSGDDRALGLLYRQFSPAIFRYLRHHTTDAELAADLTSSVFLHMLEAIQGGRSWNRSFTGWLYCIARNVLVDHVRRAGRRPQCELVECEMHADLTDMDEEVARRAVAHEVQAAIDELRPEYARLLRMRFTEDLSQAEIARRLGKREGTVKVTQHRALNALRVHLEKRQSAGALAS